jgi:hypothetical protein
MNMSNIDPAAIPDDLETITKCAELINRPYSSVYNQVRRGNITVHFFSGDAQAKVSLSEARQLFETIKKHFSAPTFRIVRHDEKSTAAQTEKSDLFA